MSATVTLPWIAVAGVFLAGVLIGWLIAKDVRVEPSLAGLDMVGGLKSPGTVRFVRKTGNFVINCKCGAVWKFSEGDGPFPPDSQPMPPGDSFTCR